VFHSLPRLVNRDPRLLAHIQLLGKLAVHLALRGAARIRSSGRGEDQGGGTEPGLQRNGDGIHGVIVVGATDVLPEWDARCGASFMV